LCRLTPVEQCAGQVHFTDRAVTCALEAIPERRKLVVEYEQFCRRPADYLRLLSDRLGLDTGNSQAGPVAFTPSSTVRVELAREIENAFARWQ